ncbi:MAG: dienelactone hydrolase [Alphaproteobacteria bacterium]|nr:MAG: dienelactone hydrolase [Alphaproteobacteria bacterium]
MPAGGGKVPLVLFSHGLGGDTSGGTLWATAWAARGLAVIQMQHAGSDVAVYRDAPTPADVPARVRAAATAEQLLARVGDARFVLNEATRRPREGACNLARIDPDRIGFAGHSMGAWTAQALAGQRWGGGVTLADRRIRAAIALSPSAPFVGDAGDAFGKIGMPFLSITGSEDGAPALAPAEVRVAAEAQRTAPYRAMPPGEKYLLVFAGADHMVFSGNARRAARPVDPHVKAVTAAATTAFWGATLLGAAKDKAFLAKELRTRLAPGDRLETK